MPERHLKSSPREWERERQKAARQRQSQGLKISLADRSLKGTALRDWMRERQPEARPQPAEVFKTETPRPGSVPKWISLTALVIAVVLFPFLLCSTSKSTLDRRKDVFIEVARLVNEPVRALQPFHARILPKDKGAVMFLDAQINACREALPLVEGLGAIKFPPDEMGRALSSGEGVREAVAGFRAGMDECKAGGGAPEATSKCLLRCMGDWASLARVVDQMRKDADWVGVRVESITPVAKKAP